MDMWRARPFFVGGLLALLVVFFILGFPAWVSLLLGLIVLIYLGYVFTPHKPSEVSAKDNRVVCSNCHYENDKGALVCDNCEVELD